jgi:Retron-type reverse transcriptase
MGQTVKILYRHGYKRTVMDVKGPLFEGKEDSLLVKQFVEKEGKLMLPVKTNQRLETLGNLAKQGKRINGLFRLMTDPYLWVQAYVNIYPNKGVVTPGVNGTSLDGMSYKRIRDLILVVKSGKYHFSPARRVLIPKSNGKSRPLGIPEGNDKVVQEVIRMILEKIYEPIFSNDSHGFRNGRSCHTALTQVKEKWTGMKWIINMDIKGYFDNIDHDVLMSLLEKYIDDKRFLTLIRFMLKAGYMEDWKFIESYSGSPQGNHASPILANIYLHELDEFMEKMKAGFRKGKKRALKP